MADITVRDARAIMAAAADMRALGERAVGLHGDIINGEHAQFAAVRDSNPDAWARRCVIKALLSPGARLDGNIAAAGRIYGLLAAGGENPTYEAVRDLIKGTGYGSVCYGSNVTNVVAWWDTLRGLSAECMTWDGLIAIATVNGLQGLGDKARSWALALYSADSDVFTLDRWMLRGFANMVGIDKGTDYAAKSPAYHLLRDFFLDLYADLGTPGMVQWAIWNEFRHAGEHASHLFMLEGM